MHEDDQYDDTDNAFDDESFKSKTQLKREMDALQDLGVALVKLPEKELARIPVPEQLADAIELARNIKNHSGLRRQLQYIGKLMRQIDVEPIQAAMEQLRLSKQMANAQFHKLEQWRDRLIAEDNDTLTEFLDQHPNADRQRLRQLVGNAKKELKQNKPPKSARQLFKYLRELQEQDQEQETE